MHPAYSVILFTTASGAGYGLLVLAALSSLSHGRASSPLFAFVVIGLALSLVTLGLLSSTAHLGRPERFWRAFSQWRSSWLSREGIVALAVYPAALGFAAAWSGMLIAPQMVVMSAALLVILAVLTVFCTAMIYAQLKTIPAWNNPYTVPGYFLFGTLTGASLLGLVSVVFGRFQAGAGPFQVVLLVLLCSAALLHKSLYWRWLAKRPHRFTMGEATGLGVDVRQWEMPHTARNFIMKEMGYVLGRRHAERLQTIALALLLGAIALAIASLWLPWLMAGVALVSLVAAWVERWLFFAQAEHVVGLYYGKEGV